MRFRVGAVPELLESRVLLSTYIVSNTGDSGLGSLRQAIVDSNSQSGSDLINFAIPGNGVHVIEPLTALPQISDQLVIDGTSQGGYQGSPLIQIEGDQAPAATDGIVVAAKYCTVKGLIIDGFGGNGIVLDSGGWGRVVSNYIGTDASGAHPLANGGDGVLIHSFGNFVGKLPTGNVIAFNRGNGVSVVGDGASYNGISGNSIFSNGRLAIDLGGDGPTANDLTDNDDGPNGLQNYPTISSAIAGATGTGITFELISMPYLDYHVELFASPIGGNPGQAQTYLGSTRAFGGNSALSGGYFFYPHPLPAGTFITATATAYDQSDGAFHGTSEVSPAVPVLVDTTPLTVHGEFHDAGWAYQPAQTITLTFNKDMTWAVSEGALKVQNLATGQTYPGRPGAILGSTQTEANTVTFSDFSILPDGNYRGTVSHEWMDWAGNPLDGNGDGVSGDDYTFNFFVLKGDIHHDRTVGFSDLSILARHFNQRGDLSAGDLNSDGRVNFKDLLIFAQHYGRTVPPVAAAAQAPSSLIATDLGILHNRIASRRATTRNT